MNRSQGFTLIEVMIVVAITGILASICVSVFQDYFIRSRVSEGLILADGTRISVGENAMFGRPFASGWNVPNATSNVAGVGIDANNGEITVTFTADAGNGTLVLAPRDGGVAGNGLTPGTQPASNITWNCNSVGSTKAGSKGTLQDKYAPANCRS